jgi:medium-chain acyl-[acyl-carrier-protein] hydrolase
MMEISTLPPQPLPVDCPIIAYAGIDDPMLPPTAIEAWGAWTSRGFRFELLPRGHFFLTEERERLIRDIVAQLPV